MEAGIQRHGGQVIPVPHIPVPGSPSRGDDHTTTVIPAGTPESSAMEGNPFRWPTSLCLDPHPAGMTDPLVQRLKCLRSSGRSMSLSEGNSLGVMAMSWRRSRVSRKTVSVPQAILLKMDSGRDWLLPMSR